MKKTPSTPALNAVLGTASVVAAGRLAGVGPAGKLPFTFNVPELQGSPYELLGGRMAYLNQAPAAQLFFKYGNHRVSVFIAQDSAVSHRGVQAPSNFTVMHWNVNGLSWFLVTDASPSTMEDLVDRCKKAAVTT